jgi:hypothetical protein
LRLQITGKVKQREKHHAERDKALQTSPARWKQKRK